MDRVPTIRRARREGALRAGHLAGRAALAACLVLVLGVAPSRGADTPARDAAPTVRADPEDVSATPRPRFAERAERVSAIVIDIPFVRTLSLVNLGLGAVFFVATSPLTAASNRLGESFEYLVRTPYDYALRRPIGRL